MDQDLSGRQTRLKLAQNSNSQITGRVNRTPFAIFYFLFAIVNELQASPPDGRL
jgi:hypothetical protein